MDTTTFYSCLYDACGAKLPNVKSLIGHMRLVHCFEKGHLCCRINKCEKIFSTSDSYRKHVEREHAFELEFPISPTPLVTDDARVSGPVEDALSDGVNESTPDESDFGTLVQLLARNVSLFALETRETHLIPKSTCRSIMSGVSSLINTFFQHLSEFIVCRLDENGFDIGKDPCLQEVLLNHAVIDSVWSNVCSDAKLKQFCREKLGLIEPKSVLLGYNKTTGKPECYQYVSVCRTVQHYVQHEDVWESINRIPNKADNVLYDYTDGTAFRQHNFFALHPDALRIHMYVDDLELCNPLGSAKKKHSITAIYHQIGNVEQKNLAALKSVHVACIAKAVHVKKYGLHKVLTEFIADIRQLESVGVEVMINGKVHNLFGSLATVSADNLASHDIGGFRMCFNSGRICRFCMICFNSICEFGSETWDGYPKLRTEKEHDMHVASVVADGTLASVYGVTKPSALHSLQSFHAVSFLPPDCIHDVLEGVIPLVLKVCLRSLIVDKIVTVQTFNERLERFKFGQNDAKNIPCTLPSSFPKSGISGSAAQKWCLFRYLALLIGDLVPVHNTSWELYISCRKMTEIIFAPSVTMSQIAYLDLLIAEHHQRFIDLAPDEITPNFHFLTHYPRLMSVYGPKKHLWCMRFESYHQYFKSVAQNTGNFKNICHTLAERNQMKKCLEQSADQCLQSDEYVTVHQSKITIRSLPQSLHMAVAKYFSCSLRNQVISVKSTVLNGVRYSVNDCFILDVVTGDVPVFFVVTYILAFDSVWGLVGNLVTCTQFLSHYHAYVVENDTEWLVLRPGTELSYHALDIYKLNITAAELKVVVMRHTVPS